MNLEKWKELYEILNRAYSRFTDEYPNMLHGSNKKIRESASARITNHIDLCCSWIMKYGDAYKMLTGEELDDYARAINWDEFKQPRYFQNDMPEFLKKIENKINSMEENEMGENSSTKS